VDADFGVELASGDERLEVPWAAPDGSCRFADLKNHPELLDEVEEAKAEPALSSFLKTVNARASILQSAKCDAWGTDEISPVEEIFALPWKFASYVDLFFEDHRRVSLATHEEFAKHVTELLKKSPDIPNSVELLIRRCYFRDAQESGFYFTLYVFGFGDDKDAAHRQWEVGLRLVENALRQAAVSY
jgi:hypothetical protein